MTAIVSADIIVIGAGMAGASVAACVAEQAVTLLLEQEEQPGYHSTGRSAAMYVRNYGNATVRALTAASAPLLENPPEDFVGPLLSPRGVLLVAGPGQELALQQALTQPGMVAISAIEAWQRVPVLRRSRLIGAAFEANARDMDVHAIHQGYLRRLQRRGGKIICRSPVTGLQRRDGVWIVQTPQGSYQSPIVVNAAGAWADCIARRAGIDPLGLIPKRRTALILPWPDNTPLNPWPMVLGIEEDIYFKPEAGKLLVSPADATPTVPGDVQAEEWDVAVAVERLEQWVNFTVDRVERRWAGLRTFAVDASPVVGWDTTMAGFFWLAGQGGYGIQMGPALAELASHWLIGSPAPLGIELDSLIEAVAPGRLRSATTIPLGKR